MALGWLYVRVLPCWLGLWLAREDANVGGVFLTKKGKGMKVIKELVVAGVIGTSAFVGGGVSGQFVSVPWATGDDFTTYKQDMGKDMLELERRMGARIDASADRVINALKK